MTSLSNERSARALDRRLGLRVRARRLELGMSQERLAEVLGVTFQQVQKYEKGVNRIAASRLFDICAALDTTAGRFFEDLEASRQSARTKPGAWEDVLATPEGLQLMALFGAIESVKVRRRVIELVRALAAEQRS